MVIFNYFIYAADYSLSTYKDEFYNTNALKTIEYFKRDVQDIVEREKLNNIKTVYLKWGKNCVHVDESTVRNTYIEQNGQSWGTRPQEIIYWIKNNIVRCRSNIRLLYIITDGMIEDSDIKRCITKNRGMMYDSVVFYAFNSNESEIDLSVAASFLKKQCSIIRNGTLMNDLNIGEGYKYDSINVSNFNTEKESLGEYIKLKFLTISKTNRQSLQEIQKLKQLRKRLFKEFESVKVDETCFDSVRDKDGFIETFKETDYYKGLKKTLHNQKTDIEKCIATLINYISSNFKSCAFDALKYDTTYHDEVTDEEVEELDNIEWAEEEKVEFPDIITFDESKNVPVILLATYNLPRKIIFHSGNNQPASFSKFKPLLDCPLFLLKDDEFTNGCLSYYYTVDVYRQLLNTAMTRDPHSGRDTDGGIILSPECDKYNDYILAKNYFDSKSMKYNKGLFYYVLWKVCDQREWMDRNVVERFRQYTLRRIAETNCFIGLSSLPLDPLITTTLPIALWYCLEISSYIFKDDDEHFSKERLQNYHGISGHMMDILTHFQYPINLDFVRSRIEIIRYVTILKRIPAKRDKYYYMVSNIFKSVDGFLVSEIEHQHNVQKLNYLKVNHKGKLDENVLNDTIDFNSHIHFVDEESVTVDRICPETLRPPFVLIDETEQPKSFYSSLLNKLKRAVVDKSNNETNIDYQPLVGDQTIDFQRIVSRSKLYISFVKEKKKYPSLEEFQGYILKRKKHGTNDLPAVFPVNTLSNIKSAYDIYQTVIEDLPVSQFILRSQSSVNRLERVKIEKSLLNTDKEIKDFICREEVYICKHNS